MLGTPSPIEIDGKAVNIVQTLKNAGLLGENGMQNMKDMKGLTTEDRKYFVELIQREQPSGLAFR